MSYVSNLTLALSVFTDRQINAASISKANPKFYHVFYVINGVNRMMVVPRNPVDIAQLQHEVGILLDRDIEAQQRLGALDAATV
jgi:hypothetical protein